MEHQGAQGGRGTTGARSKGTGTGSLEGMGTQSCTRAVVPLCACGAREEGRSEHTHTRADGLTVHAPCLPVAQGTYPPGHPKFYGGWRHFYESTEDAQGALSQYYDVQVRRRGGMVGHLGCLKTENCGGGVRGIWRRGTWGHMGHPCPTCQDVCELLVPS